MKQPAPSPRPRKRERSKLEKRDRILAAAGFLFRSKGYEATTTSLISSTAGIATGTLFLYFPSKDELLIELFSERIRSHVALFGRSFDPAGDARPQLVAFFTEMVALHGEDPELTRHFIRAIAIIRDRRIAHKVDNLARSANLAIARVLIALQRSTALDRVHSPRTAAQIMFGTYFTSLIEWANWGVNDEQLRKRIDAAVSLMLRAMSNKN